METRFTRIVDELEQLGKSYTTNEKNQRILKVLPSNWKIKVTTIKEIYDLSIYPVDSLIALEFFLEILIFKFLFC